MRKLEIWPKTTFWGLFGLGEIRPEMRDLAGWLCALEMDAENPSTSDADSTCRVCDKLRHRLVTLTGPTGYISLLSRALTLAKQEALGLRTVQIRANGILDGLDRSSGYERSILVAYLLNLLTTLIG